MANSGVRRYEIIKVGGFFTYVVYRYYGQDQYPYGTVVGVASSLWGARRVARKDVVREERQLVEVLKI